MKKYLLFLGLFLALTQSARASYVQGGHTDPAGVVTPITCSPNSGSGSVTAGNIEIVLLQKNGGGNFPTPTSTRVTTWTMKANNAAFGSFYGTITSSGVETVSEVIDGTKATIVCAEYTTVNTFDVFSDNPGNITTLNITTTKPNTDVICGLSGDVGLAFSGGAGFTLRQTGTMTTAPNGKLLLGDVPEATAGTYTCSNNAPSKIAIIDFYKVAPPNVPRHR